MRYCILAFSLLACQPRQEPTQSTWTISSQPTLAIPATTESGDVNFGVLTAATRLTSGELLVADGATSQLIRFSPQGSRLGTLGRPGSGPGEFSTLWWMGRCGADSLWIHDLNRPYLSRFSGNGGFARQLQPPEVAGIVRCGANGQLALLTLGAPPDPSSTTVRPKANLLMARGDSFVTLRSDIPANEFALVNSMPVPSPLGRMSAIAVVGPETILGTADSAVLERIGPDGRLIGIIRLPGGSRRPTSAEVKQATDALLLTVPAPVRKDLEPTLKQVPVPDRLPPYFGLWVDPSDRLWVLRSVPGAAPVLFTIVDNTGRVLGAASSSTPFIPLEVGTDAILGSREGTDGDVTLVLLPYGPS